MGTPGDQFWVPHPELIFAPCLFKGSQGADATFVALRETADVGGETITYPLAKLQELAKVQAAQLDGVENVCTLEEVSQAALLHTVRTRFLRSPPQIYTRVQRIMVAVNPFQSLPIYSSEHMRQYLDSRDSMELPPHIFGIGADAIRGLRQGDGRNQAVLISGESGAGKTESTKLVLAYVASAVGGSQGGIQDKIMQTNPVLESFGNAMTVRNNNSSRFGKWLQMTISASGMVQGCSVTDYLLELTRVCRQGEAERNYHIFFQMTQAKNELKQLNIGEPSSYRYLKGCLAKAPGVDDGKFFEELKEAFNGLGIQSNLQLEIFQIVVGILTLGNADFSDKGDATQLVDDAPVKQAADLLGVDKQAFAKSMTVRCIVVGKDVTEANRDANQAAAARDGLARLLYGRLFKLLIAKINALLSSDKAPAGGQFFGVLDIAGFESFEKNSLEQLFINLSNEHLQQHFNNHIFKMELEDYKVENVSLEGAMDFQDNSDIIALLDAKGSILAILDEEVAMPKATDQTFAAKVCKAHETHPRLVRPKFAGALLFGVRHFAGEVTYACEGFLEKNVDRPPDEAPKLFQSSTNSIVKEIGTTIAEELAEAGGAGGRGKKAKTVSSTFRGSLASLVQKLGEAEPHFIRCIKPNPEKVPGKFSAKLAMEQLVCSGVFEAVRIRQSGFASRVLFAEFIGRYRIIVPKALQKQVFGPSAPKDDLQRAKTFVGALPGALRSAGAPYTDGDVVLGKSKVFARARVMQALDRTRDMALASYALYIQRMWRGSRVRRMMKECMKVFNELKMWRQANDFYTKPGSQHTAIAKLKTVEAIDAQIKVLEAILLKAQRMPLGAAKRKEVDRLKDRMAMEAQEVRRLRSVLNSIEPMDVDKAILRARELELPNMPELEQLAARYQSLKVQVPLVKAIQKAIESKDIDEMLEVLNIIKKHGLHTHPENWIDELRGEELAGILYTSMEYLKAQKKQEDLKQKGHEELARGLHEDVSKQKKELAKEDAEERKRITERPRKKRATITGLTEEDQQRIFVNMEQAVAVLDAEALEEALRLAIKEGVDLNTPATQQAKLLFEQLQTKDFIIEQLEDKKEAVNIHKQDPNVLKSLQNLLKQAARLGITEPLVDEAKKVMQTRARQRARSTIKGRCFEDIHLQELSLADNAFANLFEFPNLHAPEQWRGHAPKYWLGSAPSGKDVMLKHSTHELRGSLTKLANGQEQDAIASFRNILCWMGDMPVPEVQRETLASTIAGTAAKDKRMADEIYVQVMKQLTENPSSRSLSRGWELMCSLCHQACPSSDLNDFLHVFLLRALPKAGEELVPIVRQCLADLNLTASPEKLAEDDLMPLTVTLIDHSTRKVHVPSSSTLKQLSDVISEQLRITKPKEFTCFMQTEGLVQSRLVPESAVVSTLIEKWVKLKDRTKRETKLLYRRRLLRMDETLNPGDFTHSRLTYRQALADYLQYPVAEDHKEMYRIAAAVLWVERDTFEQQIAKDRLADPDVLEQLLPEIAIREKRRWQVAKSVKEEYMELAKTLDPQESRLMSMSRAMSEMQKLKLFGAFYWTGSQVIEVPQDLVAIEEAPEQVCVINPQVPESEYFVCVDWFGIRFVAQGTGADGKSSVFQRGFLFNKEAVERVLFWGAKKNILQFVVSSVDATQPARGRVPMTISIDTTAAIDVAYAVHMVHVLKSGNL